MKSKNKDYYLVKKWQNKIKTRDTINKKIYKQLLFKRKNSYNNEINIYIIFIVSI
jgi:hypothetical protein